VADFGMHPAYQFTRLQSTCKFMKQIAAETPDTLRKTLVWSASRGNVRNDDGAEQGVEWTAPQKGRIHGCTYGERK
jgi:hypothetical protein